MPRPDAKVEVRPLAPDDWPVIERLFGRNGACAGCWCMSWRLPSGGKLWKANQGEPNRRAFRRLVESGTARGVLAFAGDEPVGWCSIGPRAHFPKLEKSRVLRHPAPPEGWVVSCFYIPARWRGQGVGRALLGAALDLARAEGASVLDGYPVNTRGKGRPVTPVFAWTGVPALFQAHGFTDVTPRTQERPVFRFVLVGAKRATRKRRP
jgi:GNAT superfamily N-acetyltransferase